MNTTFLTRLKEQLKQGVEEKRHPFRCGVLGTISADNNVTQRSIILRTVSDDLQLTFHTDARSQKISHIKENNTISLLFYHPEKQLQITLEGSAQIISDQTVLHKSWKKVPTEAQKNYTSTVTPGSKIENSDAITFSAKENHFAIIAVRPDRMEYLQLNQAQHTRVQFTKIKHQWKEEFIAP